MIQAFSQDDPEVRLRDVVDRDLPEFYRHQLDAEANRMAAFTAEDPTDQAAFDQHWAKILSDDKILIKTILFGEHVVGHIASFERNGDLEVTYWIDKIYWGKGIASSALIQFLEIQLDRPIYAHAAKDNIASLRVLEKAGFGVVGTERGYANARGEEITETILVRH